MNSKESTKLLITVHDVKTFANNYLVIEKLSSLCNTSAENMERYLRSRDEFTIQDADSDCADGVKALLEPKGVRVRVEELDGLSADIREFEEALNQAKAQLNGDYNLTMTISNGKLNKVRQIRGSTAEELRMKAVPQITAWYEEQKKKETAEDMKKNINKMKELAVERTKSALSLCEGIENTLRGAIKETPYSWDEFKICEDFNIAKPRKPEAPEVAPLIPPEEPTLEEPKYKVPNLLDRILNFPKKLPNESELMERFEKDRKTWQEKKAQDEENWRWRIEEANKRLEEKYEKDLCCWELEKSKFVNRQKEINNHIEKQKEEYEKGGDRILPEYFSFILHNSIYPISFEKNVDVDYNPETKILIVEYQLPNPEVMPTVKEVKYIQSRIELREVHWPEAMNQKIYDTFLYKIVLRSIYEIWRADIMGGIESIVFNGWVKSLDKRTGREVKACILSLQAMRKEFDAIDLLQVDARECFKSLKGFGSTKLHGLVPIQPILQISRADKRFVPSYDVTDRLEESVNLASMPWEDFEHLIRELFERKFKERGGEVKVTRASRDGGVDAVIFDADPITGGKMVVQAKRYTNVVGLSAVRDLYGTVINEGAMKGILITTADYGPDAHDFAREKPLTLLNGNNLLHLLGEFGHKARIDLAEAKQSMAKEENR